MTALQKFGENKIEAFATVAKPLLEMATRALGGLDAFRQKLRRIYTPMGSKLRHSKATGVLHIVIADLLADENHAPIGKKEIAYVRDRFRDGHA